MTPSRYSEILNTCFFFIHTLYLAKLYETDIIILKMIKKETVEREYKISDLMAPMNRSQRRTFLKKVRKLKNGKTHNPAKS